MNDEIRTLIQTKLSEVSNVEVSGDMTDNFIENSKTYFSYSLQFDYDNSNYDKKYVYRISLTGYLKRKEEQSSNTLNTLDTKTSEILNKLKELNIKSSSTDLNITDNIRKIRITGWCYFDGTNLI